MKENTTGNAANPQAEEDPFVEETFDEKGVVLKNFEADPKEKKFFKEFAPAEDNAEDAVEEAFEEKTVTLRSFVADPAEKEHFKEYEEAVEDMDGEKK